MADDIAVFDDPVSDAGCGCCQPESKTVADQIRQLEARRDRLEQRLRALDLVGAR